MTELDEVQFRSTPTILCLNRQIYEEAQDMLRKRTLRISHPPQYPIKGIYDLSHVISDEALSKISKIQFELHTYAATERRHDIMQTDWKGKSMYKDECLADSYPWATLLKDCFQVWRGTQDPRYLELSIDHCSGERSQYNLAVFGHKVCPYGLFVWWMFVLTWIDVGLRRLCPRCLGESWSGRAHGLPHVRRCPSWVYLDAGLNMNWPWKGLIYVYLSCCWYF